MRDRFSERHERHVHNHLPAYVHGQLKGRSRERVQRHLDHCVQCRAALSREQFLVRDLKKVMPLVGRPDPGQLRRLWPRIRAEFRAAPPLLKLLPSFSVIAMVVLVLTISVSSLFSGSLHANAAPEPLVPADIKATNTPWRTEEPQSETPNTEIAASQTANAPLNPPQASPAPPPRTVGFVVAVR